MRRRSRRKKKKRRRAYLGQHRGRLLLSFPLSWYVGLSRTVGWHRPPPTLTGRLRHLSQQKARNWDPFFLCLLSLIWEASFTIEWLALSGWEKQQQLWNRNAVSDFHECTQIQSLPFPPSLLPCVCSCVLHISLSSFRLNTHCQLSRPPLLESTQRELPFDGKRTRWTSCWWKVCVYVYCTHTDYFLYILIHCLLFDVCCTITDWNQKPTSTPNPYPIPYSLFKK